MNLVEQINTHQYLYLVEISEPDVNVLRIVIDEARASESETRTLEVGETRLSELRPMSRTDCRRYEIIFGSYVAYVVRNESYVVMDQSEVFTGRLLNVPVITVVSRAEPCALEYDSARLATKTMD